ncbi:MAG: glutamate synthase, partial [bacterium]
MVNRLIKNESEGGCGVIGFAATAPIAGKHLLQPLIQMHNRGNGKGGGIAAVGCFPDFHDFYAIHIGYLDPASRRMVEDEFITPFFSIEYVEKQSSIDDHREIPGLEIRPPEVWRYFCRVKEDVLKKFAKKGGIEDLVKAEDEFVYRNSHALNQKWYVSLEDKKAFVLSHGKDMMVLKGVGYAEQLAKYYQLENFKAYVWIGHQRYPTRGRVWHPGGAHPFVGLNDALVHNGDFANYQSICDYLRQRDIHPQFLTDTEVAALLFDFYTRVLEYPLEYTIEALAPTTERDFDMLPKIKQRLYRAIRTAHIHGSPDGPWFFIIARNDVKHHTFQLIGITDTSMLRPQVFALSEGEVSIGVVASEKQAIDALLESLSQENEKICSVADLYWNSRGGSHTDGGAFIFSLSNTDDQIKEKELICTDKFGKVVAVAKDQVDLKGGIHEFSSLEFKDRAIESKLLEMIEADGAYKIFQYLTDGVRGWDYADFLNHCRILARIANESDLVKTKVIEGLTLLRDRHYHTGHKKRKWLLAIIDQSLEKIFSSLPRIETHSEGRYILLESGDRKELISPANPEQILVINAQGFPPEGEDSVARLMVAAHEKGFKQFIAYNLKGDRFLGCGLGPNTNGVRIDL